MTNVDYFVSLIGEKGASTWENLAKAMNKVQTLDDAARFMIGYVEHDGPMLGADYDGCWSAAMALANGHHRSTYISEESRKRWMGYEPFLGTEDKAREIADEAERRERLAQYASTPLDFKRDEALYTFDPEVGF